MNKKTFIARSEAFGYNTSKPWAEEAFRLLFSVPRAYLPIVQAWDIRYPGTRSAINKLTKMGFLEYQPGVVINTRTKELSDKESKKVPRYKTTTKGHQLTVDASEDLRVLEEKFPRTATHNTYALLQLLKALDLEDSHARFGLSALHACETSSMAHRTVKWWIRRLIEDGYVKELPTQYADTRELIPPHWRVTKQLCKQLIDALDAFSVEAVSVKKEFRLKRSRFLTDIDPARVGISGATDYDHDVECQRILATLITSPQSNPFGHFRMEPRIVLTATDSNETKLINDTGDELVFYQPDAELYESYGNKIRRSIVEYDRYQSRRDAWGHIEGAIGYVHQKTLPVEPVILRFVVDTRRREAGYVSLIEAFADYALDHPEKMPANDFTLAVTSIPRLMESQDPLDENSWFRLQLPQATLGDETERVPVMHAQARSPYNDYFSRKLVA